MPGLCSFSTLVATRGLRLWQLLLLPVACVVCCAGVAGFTASLASSYADGPGSSNNYTATWLAGWGLVLGIQAACVVLNAGVAAGSPGSARPRVWRCFSLWMFSCGVILLVCLGLALPSQSGWAVLWLVAAGIIFVAARQHARQALLLPQDTPPPAWHAAAPPPADEEACAAPAPVETGEQPVPPANEAKVRLPLQESVQQPPGSCGQHAVSRRRARWQRCCVGCGECMAWSSLFWAAVLGLFLVLQAGYLASDRQRFPPPGVLVDVPITMAGGGTTTVKLHLSCAGPITPGLSTFILEAGGGAPGISLAGIRDGLAAGGRRACFYDRLGYGWSQDAFKPTTRNRSTEALWGLLAAVPAAGMAAPPPYILVGHSAGGQLALQFAASHPDDVAGLALLDSYSDVAIALRMLGANATLPPHIVAAPGGAAVDLPDAGLFYAETVPLLDLLRAVTPLAWARWVTAAGRSGPYAGATSAAYGNNQEWHAQYVEVLGLAGGGSTVADSLTLANGGQAVWRGAGWPDLSPRPVLLMPAAETLALPAGACPASGTDFSLSTDCVAAVQAPAAPPEVVYADLYLAYLATLSFNASLFVVPGSHAFPWETPQAVVEQLLLKFGGV